LKFFLKNPEGERDDHGWMTSKTKNDALHPWMKKPFFDFFWYRWGGTPLTRLQNFLKKFFCFKTKEKNKISFEKIIYFFCNFIYFLL